MKVARYDRRIKRKRGVWVAYLMPDDRLLWAEALMGKVNMLPAQAEFFARGLRTGTIGRLHGMGIVEDAR